MALLEDPTGAKFAIWQPKGSRGARIMNEIGTPAWPELATRDTSKAESFYTRLFGWSAKRLDTPGMAYTEWQLGGQSFGGMLEMEAKWGDAPPHWGIYVMVSNCKATADKAAVLGGQVCVQPRTSKMWAASQC